MKKIFTCLLVCFAFRLASAQELKIAVLQELGSFNPVTQNLASNESFSHFVKRNMVFINVKGQPEAELVVEVPNQKNKKMKFVTVKGKRKVLADWEILPAAQWGDKTPITCHDWILGWQVGLSPNVSASDRSPYNKIENIEVDKTNPKLCHVTYINDSWNFDRDLPPLLPVHLEKEIFEKYNSQAEAYDQNTLYTKAPTTLGLWNGPYVVSEFKIGSHVILKANPNYLGAKPKIETVSIRMLSSSSTLRSLLDTGAINMISSVAFPPDTAIEFSKTAGPKYKVHFKNSPIFQGLFFNLESEKLKDANVRRALEMAINKQELVKAFFNSEMLGAETMISPNDPAFIKRPAHYDIAKAKSLLAEAGWTAGAAGAVRTKDGQPLSLIYRTSAGLKILETIQSYICDQWKEVGVQCLTKNQPPRVLLGETVPHGDFDIAMYGMPVLPDFSEKGQLSSSAIPSKTNSWAGSNTSRWRNKTVDQLVDQFEVEWDFNKRLKITKKIEAQVEIDKPFVPIYHRREAVLLPIGLTGFTDDFTGTNFVHPEKWQLH